MKFSHIHVYEFCLSSLVLCNTGANLKPPIFKVSQKVQTNSGFNIIKVNKINIHEIGSSTCI